MNNTLETINHYRKNILPSSNPHRFIELIGGREVKMLFFEPDPETFRDDFYYNSRRNVLYKKIKAIDPSSNMVDFYWKKSSEY